MTDTEKKYFEILKQKIAEQLLIGFPSVDQDISKWKGQDIIYFQEELQQKVNGRISEKWFYTHLKSTAEKLPRIDMLNMLSEYVGYTDWNDLKLKNGAAIPRTKLPFSTRLLIILSPIIIVTVAFFGVLLFRPPATCEFCFVDSNSREKIDSIPIEIILLHEGESPQYMQCDSNGCFYIESDESLVKFIVKSSYYKTDTITRVLNKSLTSEQIRLKTNDYAMIIHYFSTANVADWKKRRAQLDKMIASDAQIFQVFDDNLGMEMYNKHEFINKLTMPLKSLKNIEIIETVYTGSEISTLRFRQNPTE